MRKLLAVWALVALILAGSVFAETVVTMSDGSVFVEKPSSEVVSKKEVTFGSGVLAYGDAWKRAYAKPGTVVPMETHMVFARDGLFHIVKTEVADVGIRYDNMKSIGLVHDVAGTPKVSFNPSAILWLLSVAAVVFGGLRVRENKDATFALVTTTLATFALVTTTLAALVPLVPLATPLALAATLALVAALAVATPLNKKMFYIFAGIYGILMAVIMVAFLLG